MRKLNFVISSALVSLVFSALADPVSVISCLDKITEEQDEHVVSLGEFSKTLDCYSHV